MMIFRYCMTRIMNIKRIVKKIFRLSMVLITIMLMMLLFNFFSIQNDFLLKKSIDHQINYLGRKIHDLSKEAQNRFPEGRLFTNLLFALSLIDYSNKSDYSDFALIEKLIEDCTSDDAKVNFGCQRTIQYGAFYNGWINYTLKQYIESSLFQKSNNSEKILQYRAEFEHRIITSQCDSVQVLETYEYSICPSDNIVCIASLDDRYNDMKMSWIEQFYTCSQKGMITHEGFGENAQLIRGSSQALMHFFLYEIDSQAFNRTIRKYRNQFVNQRFGIEWVKEYIDGKGDSDVDSGPIIMGYGSVATIMNSKLSLRTIDNHSRMTLGILNMLGMPIHIFGQKYFLAGHEPMYDIFFLWNAVEAY